MKLTKKKRLEKTKVKLKAKKLPRGQNVTDTSFKARKIVLPSQLKDPKPGDIVTKKQLNIKEIISRLDHHRPQIRIFGLDALKRIVLSHDPSQLALHLPRILKAIASKLLDLFSNIRDSALDILKVLLAKIPEGTLEPHFASINVYMVAAMTHINPFVQKDSLRMLDLLLDVAPTMMKNCAKTFLPTFLDLVSSAKNNKGTERSLFDVYNKKVSNIKWREMVLSRLTKYFSILITEQRDESTSVHVTTQLTSKTSAVIHWSGDTALYVAEHLSFIQGVCYLANIFGSSSYSIHQSKSDEEFLKTHVDQVLPILLDSWTEVGPKAKDPKGFIHGQQAAITLQFILETLIRLWKCLEDSDVATGHLCSLTYWFKSKYGKKIMKKFVCNFPYTSDCVVPYNGKDCFTGSETMLVDNMVPFTKNCVEQNLLICYLVECLDCFSEGDITDRVIQCLNNCIRNWESKKSLPTLKKVLTSLLTSKNQGWPKGKILETIIKSLEVKSLEEEMKLILLDFVCDYVQVCGSLGKVRNKELDKWVSELPLLLLRPTISMKVVLALRRMSSQNWELFRMNLKKHRRSITDNLSLIKITGAGSQVEGQKAIIEILFYAGDAHIFKYLRQSVVQYGGSEEIVEFINSMEEFHLYARSFFNVKK